MKIFPKKFIVIMIIILIKNRFNKYCYIKLVILIFLKVNASSSSE